jgi:hypothetical protein
MPEKKGGRRGLKPLEMLVIAGVLLVFILPVLERGGKLEGQQAPGETQVFQEDAQAAEDEAASVDKRQQIANFVKVGGFIFMAILVPTLLIREWLRQRKPRRR